MENGHLEIKVDAMRSTLQALADERGSGVAHALEDLSREISELRGEVAVMAEAMRPWQQERHVLDRQRTSAMRDLARSLRDMEVVVTPPQPRRSWWPWKKP